MRDVVKLGKLWAADNRVSEKRNNICIIFDRKAVSGFIIFPAIKFFSRLASKHTCQED